MDNNTYPKITNKYKTKFGISSKLIQKLHNELYNLYSNTNLKNIIKPKSIHTIINDLFITEYYPEVSKNYNINNKTAAVIMGTQALNMNIPEKLKNLLYTETEDIDLKIYTTELHYDKKNNTMSNIKNVLSLFRYIIITLLFFMKQIISEIIDYTNSIFMPTISNYKNKKLKYSNKTIKNNLNILKSRKTGKTGKTGKTKKTKTIYQKSGQKGGKKSVHISDKKIEKKLINHTKTNYGFLKNINISVQIKNNSNKNLEKTQENLDITNLSYDDIYDTIYKKINDIDLLITTKINYKLYYSKLLTIPKFQKSLTFSDTKVYYPNMFENPTFYSYYLVNYYKNPKNKTKMTLELLDKYNLSISEIIKLSTCGNNCNFIDIKSLQLDLILMLHYAEFINDENYENNTIIVPISALFKYRKYFMKFLKLNIIIKFYNKTLNKDFVNKTTEIINYLSTQIPITKTNGTLELASNNILYKKALNKFHQNFFIKQTMFPEYELLRDCVNDYNNIKLYINKSRLLFTDLYKDYNTTKQNDILGNNNSLLNILDYIINKEDSMSGSSLSSDKKHEKTQTQTQTKMKTKTKTNTKTSTKTSTNTTNLILYDDQNFKSLEINENDENVEDNIALLNKEFNKELKNMKKIGEII
jgi:hypothetical protein